MDKRTITAFALSVLVLIGFQLYFSPNQSQPANVENAKNITAPTENNGEKVELPVAVNSSPIELNQTNQTNQINVPGKELSTFDVETELLKITFNENTGDIREAKINKFEDKNFARVFKSKFDRDYLKVYPETGGEYKYTKSESDNKITVTFSSISNGFGVTKIYEIMKDSYKIDASVKITNTSGFTLKQPLVFEIGAGLGEGFEESQYLFSGPQMYDNKKIREEKENDVEEPVVYPNPKWIGYTGKYSLFAVASDELESGRIENYNGSALVKASSQISVNPSSSYSKNFTIFVGPKQYDLIKSLNLKLEKSIEFGIFSFLAIPMLKFLNFIYGVVQNYGVAIIILTIIIKILTYPLTNKSMVSMKKMQKLQPEMAKLKEKYGADKQKLNTATMELYKKEGVNPFGGCLPIILQIPVFFALYKTLLVSIELTGSPFFGWITDLSMKDPYYITPVLMGISMFIQQKMTPAAGGDPLQQKLFMFMPIIFTFLFLSFPSGLVVYWLTNNILSIAQQYFINKKLA